MTYEELREALDVFGLGDRATLQDIKARHRELVKRHHPDAGAQGQEPIRRVNAAHAVIAAYVKDYRFSFAEEEFLEQQPEQRLWNQFRDDPIWSKG